MPFTASTEPVPAGLRTDEFALRRIVADDTERDYAAVMETREQAEAGPDRCRTCR